MNTQRVVVVAKRSAYETHMLVRKDPVFVKLATEQSPIVARMVTAYEEHQATEELVLDVLKDLKIEHRVIDAPWEPLDLRGVTLVLTVGGDGTLLVTSHQLGKEIPILGINSSPSTSFGYFCSLQPSECAEGIPKALRREMPSLALTRMEVRIDGRVLTKRVLNDALFCHASPAATSRYIVEFGAQSEDQKSSGFWIGPAAGSTAAQRSAGGRILSLDSRELQLVVREPIAYRGPLLLSKVIVPDGKALKVISKMPEGKLFLDGPNVSHDVGMAVSLEFRASDDPLHILGLVTRHRKRRRGEQE